MAPYHPSLSLDAPQLWYFSINNNNNTRPLFVVQSIIDPQMFFCIVVPLPTYIISNSLEASFSFYFLNRYAWEKETPPPLIFP